jgi:hypothetical protein
MLGSSMQYKVGDKVVLKHDLKDSYRNPEWTSIVTGGIRAHSGHTFRVVGIYKHTYIATCDCGHQYNAGESGIWFLLDEMVDKIPKVRKVRKVDRFERILTE